MAKRKTYTSTEVKNRYNKKTYTMISLHVKKDIAEEYKARCNQLGVPYSRALHDAISDFLRDNPPSTPEKTED